MDAFQTNHPWRGRIGGRFFQTSRIVHYLVYFLIAVGIGACGIDSGLLVSNGKLARRWPIWVVGGLGVFGLATGVAMRAMTSQNTPYLWGTMAGLAFTLSCATTCLAFLALFVRIAKRPNSVCDSLRDNAYGIYLIHYVFVSWLQYALLKTQLLAPVKGLVVFLCALALSWSATAALRRIPAVARVI